jgi:5-histidylcysteine sulfoxide synthase
MNYITQNIDLTQGSVESKREEIKEYFNKTYELYEKLFDILNNDKAYYEKPCILRHPLIFYYAHTATFFINKLLLAKLIPNRINQKFESMFAVGVDEMSWDDLDEKHYNWPTIDEARSYRKEVKKRINNLIDTINFTMPIDWNSPMWNILMGIEHERIHIETSSVLIRQLEIKWIQENETFPYCLEDTNVLKNKLINVKGGKVSLGKKRDHFLYGWDNEYGKKDEEINNFLASQFLVSNKEFMEFIDDDGYTTNAYWSKEALAWREHNNAKYPQFWIKKSNGFMLRVMTKEINLPLSWPVEVNYLEAKAFCEWKSIKENKNIRMPNEAEYKALQIESNITDEHCVTQINANFNLERYASPCPVNFFKQGKFYDIVGNVWQWNETTFNGFKGFKTHPSYDDFSTPTFDGRHNLIKGGSWISTGNEIALHARYAFRRHFYQHAGFRYIEEE